MDFSGMTHRRGFLGRIAGAAAALSVLNDARPAEAQPAGPDDWIKGVKGTHRCLFDFPQHKNGMPLLHILNYLSTYSEAYKTTPGQVGAVGTFYGIGGQSSIPLAFNDAMWAKYELGAYTGLKDGAGKPHTRNVLYKPTPADLNLLMDACSRRRFRCSPARCPGSASRASRRWERRSCCAPTPSADGARSSRRGARARWPTSRPS